jgi:hypothetical protein
VNTASSTTRTDPLLLRNAQRVLSSHRPGPTGRCCQPHCCQQLWPCTAATWARRAAVVARGLRPSATDTRWMITEPAHSLPPRAGLPHLAADVLDTLYWFPTATMTAIARRCRTSIATLRHTLTQLRHHGLVCPVING